MLIWPISDLYYPFDHSLHVDGIVNSFGSGFEQRIITDIPRGPRADGEGGFSTYVGRNTFQLTIKNMRLVDMSHPTNAHINNSVRALWKFYKSTFYDKTTGQVFWQSFFFYNPVENNDISTWTGSVGSAGMNSRNEPVTNVTGRYLVRFAEITLNFSQFKSCLFNVGGGGALILIEVAA